MLLQDNIEVEWVLLREWCFLLVVVVEFLSHNSTNQPTREAKQQQIENWNKTI
jgi:hypothetical protein